MVVRKHASTFIALCCTGKWCFLSTFFKFLPHEKRKRSVKIVPYIFQRRLCLFRIRSRYLPSIYIFRLNFLLLILNGHRDCLSPKQNVNFFFWDVFLQILHLFISLVYWCKLITVKINKVLSLIFFVAKRTTQFSIQSKNKKKNSRLIFIHFLRSRQPRGQEAHIHIRNCVQAFVHLPAILNICTKCVFSYLTRLQVRLFYSEHDCCCRCLCGHGWISKGG